MTLPQSRAFITSLISSLNTSPTTPTPTSNPLKQASAADRSVLLTLHVLFPNELLSALDLLDRDLVTRFLLTSESNIPPPTSGQSREPVQDTGTQQNQDTNMEHDSSRTLHDAQDNSKPNIESKNSVYYVRSAQQSSSNSRFRDPVASTAHYEVRTSSWSCSCPAFVFSAFPAAGASTDEQEQEAVTVEAKEQEWMVGGLSLGRDVPMCKHLLACVLAERAAPFGGYVKTREVSVEELAGWAAGWGG